MSDRLTRYGRRVVLVGQAPWREGDPSKPLTGRTGRKLAELADVVFPGEYARTFERVNILREYPGPSSSGKGDAFPVTTARVEATRLLPELRGRVAVLLGRNVAKAVLPSSLSCVGWLTWHVWKGATFGLIPHPSPLVRWWNDGGNMERAMVFMKDAAELSRAMGERWRRESAWLRERESTTRGEKPRTGFGCSSRRTPTQVRGDS